VFDDINSRGHSSFFGDEFNHMRTEFFDRYVRPMDRVSLDISKTVNALLNPDQFRILSSVEDFQSIPPCMELAITFFPPVRKLLEEGRISGFGYAPDSLQEDDVYGRLISNFTCEDVAVASDDNGYYDVHAVQMSDDPDMSDDELYAIHKTREYILNKLLAETDRDPTDISMSRG
jgi:hypothetical protein